MTHAVLMEGPTMDNVVAFSAALREWRCSECRRVLCEYVPVDGLWLKKRCDRCNHWNELHIPHAA